MGERDSQFVVSTNNMEAKDSYNNHTNFPNPSTFDNIE